MTRDEIAALFARRRDAWQRLDAAALAADHADTCVMVSPMAGSVKGRDSIEQVYNAWFKAFSDLTLQDEDLIVDGDRVVQVAKASGTDTGGFMGLPPTSKTFAMSVVMIYGFTGKQISRFQAVYDFSGVLIQIGVLRAKPV